MFHRLFLSIFFFFLSLTLFTSCVLSCLNPFYSCHPLIRSHLRSFNTPCLSLYSILSIPLACNSTPYENLTLMSFLFFFFLVFYPSIVLLFLVCLSFSLPFFLFRWIVYVVILMGFFLLFVLC